MGGAAGGAGAEDGVEGASLEALAEAAQVVGEAAEHGGGAGQGQVVGGGRCCLRSRAVGMAGALLRVRIRWSFG